MNNTNPFPLPDDTMPPLPKAGEYGPQVCSTVRLYLAILDDLSPREIQLLREHVDNCVDCTTVHRFMQRTTRVFASLPESAPSSHVDQAVMSAIAAKSNRKIPTGATNDQNNRHAIPTPSYITSARERRRSMVGATLAVALAAGALKSRAVKTAASVAHDLGSDSMHVETVMPDHLDVIAVGNHHAMLGLDMMHHVAQWGANDWSVDETAFDLAELRSDLDAHRAVYLDQDVFQGHAVYRIRARNGLVLLLDMHYMPVNVLRGAVGPGTGEPIYDSLMLMPPSHVSSSMWSMNVPAGFHMGTLPKKP